VLELVLGEDPLAVGDPSLGIAPQSFQKHDALGGGLELSYGGGPEDPGSFNPHGDLVYGPGSLFPADSGEDIHHLDLRVLLPSALYSLFTKALVLPHELLRGELYPVYDSHLLRGS